MDFHEAERMLDKYWQGETTLEEERRLKDFFRENTGTLPDTLKEAAPLFDFYEGSAGIMAPAITGPWDGEHKKTVGMRATWRVLRSYWEYAAIFILILASVWIIRPAPKTTSQPVAVQDTYTDPQEAMAATQKALALLSANLNRGKEEMTKLALFNEAQQKVSGE